MNIQTLAIVLQCVSVRHRCNYQADCRDNSDERMCDFDVWTPNVAYLYRNDNQPPFAAFFNTTDGIPELKAIRPAGRKILDGLLTLSGQPFLPDYSIRECPGSHFMCRDDEGPCLPVFVRCNTILDCPGREDEAGCQEYTCPGYYRCRGSRVCVHPYHVCDGLVHCPQQDDELYCGLRCPQNCSCQGLEFTCNVHADVVWVEYPSVRYLDGERSGLTPAQLQNNTLLIYLSLQHCHLSVLHLPFSLLNLQILDIGFNHIQVGVCVPLCICVFAEVYAAGAGAAAAAIDSTSISFSTSFHVL